MVLCILAGLMLTRMIEKKWYLRVSQRDFLDQKKAGILIELILQGCNCSGNSWHIIECYYLRKRASRVFLIDFLYWMREHRCVSLPSISDRRHELNDYLIKSDSNQVANNCLLMTSDSCLWTSCTDWACFFYAFVSRDLRISRHSNKLSLDNSWLITLIVFSWDI